MSKRNASVESKVRKVIAEQLGIREEEIANDANFINDLGADSLDIVELIMALEEEYDVEIPDDEAEKILTVQHAIDFVTAKL